MVTQVCKFEELKVGQCFMLFNSPERFKDIAYKKTSAAETYGPIEDNALRLDKMTPAFFCGYTAVVPLEDEPAHQPLLFFDEFTQARAEFAYRVESQAA